MEETNENNNESKQEVENAPLDWEEPTKKKRRVVTQDSSEEEEEEEAKKKKENAVVERKEQKVVEDSDEEDNEPQNEETRSSEGEENDEKRSSSGDGVKEKNEEEDDEGGGSEKPHKKEKSAKNDDDLVEEDEEGESEIDSEEEDEDEDEETFGKKKKKKSKSKKAKSDKKVEKKVKRVNGILQISDEEKERLSTEILDKMDKACKADWELRKQGKPASHKLKLLKEVVEKVSNRQLHSALVRLGVASKLCDWLRPSKSGTLPNESLRTQIIRLIGPLPFEYDIVKDTDLGKVLNYLRNNKEETLENKRQIKVIMDDWIRKLIPDKE